MEGELKGGHYQVGKLIRSGGMGDVYHAQDIRLDRHVAFKVIKPQYLSDPQFRERLRREAITAAAITHPGIAQPYDYQDDGKEAFIVYEFVEGVTLQNRLGEHPFTTEEVLDVGIKIADALVAVHEKGFVHRDLKPANIMLTPRPDGPDRVKILDFGLVKRLPILSEQGPTTAGVESLTEPGMQPGTIDYMSPEQLRSERVDQRSDIHALGLILYEMASGVNPYRGNDTASTIANILTREPRPLSDLSPVSPVELGQIIRKCLRKNRDERYQTANELLVDLTNFRRDRSRPAGDGSATVAAPPETPLAVSRSIARVLFLLIQGGYLAMYIGFARYLPRHPERLFDLISTPTLIPLFFVVAVCGAAVRLYFMSTVGFDYPDSGRLFRRVFPVLAFFDAVWASTPLLLYHELEGLAWVCVVGLAYLPFSQRSLIFSAYAPRGGRTSGVRTTSAA
jgi:tRNA A-37 threonylcarbamoyl transferase component Bud32